MEDKTYYGLDSSGTLVGVKPVSLTLEDEAFLTPSRIGKPAPRGLTGEDVGYLVDELAFVARACGDTDIQGVDEDRIWDYYDGVKAALRLAIRRINRMERKRWEADGSPREGGDQA